MTGWRPASRPCGGRLGAVASGTRRRPARTTPPPAAKRALPRGRPPLGCDALDARPALRHGRVMSRRQPRFEISSEILLRAYSIGMFPMAEDRDADHLFWIEPEQRGVFPLDGLVVSRSLAKTTCSDLYQVRADRAFEAVMKGCANRDRTWINADILRLYCELFERGFAHSIEAYQDGELVGGLYGVALGAAFFGESMFHLARDASKVALVHLFARLRLGGYRLLDAQFITPHLASLGAVEISQAARAGGRFSRRFRGLAARAADVRRRCAGARSRGRRRRATARSLLKFHGLVMGR